MRGRRQAYPNLGHGSNPTGGGCGNRSTAGAPHRRTRPSSIRSRPFPAAPLSLIDPSSVHPFPLGAPVVGGRRTGCRLALPFLWMRIAGRGAASRPAPAFARGGGRADVLSGLRTCFRFAHPLWVSGAPVAAWRSCSYGCGLRVGVRCQRPAPAVGVGVCPGWGRAATLSGVPVSAWRTRCEWAAHPLPRGAPVRMGADCGKGRGVNGQPRRWASASAQRGAVRPFCLGAPVSAWRTRSEWAAHPFPRGAPVRMGADCGKGCGVGGGSTPSPGPCAGRAAGQRRHPLTGHVMKAGSSYGWASRNASTTPSSKSPATTHSTRTSGTCSGSPTSPMNGCAPGRGVKRPVPGEVNAQWE